MNHSLTLAGHLHCSHLEHGMLKNVELKNVNSNSLVFIGLYIYTIKLIHSLVYMYYELLQL